MAHKLRRRSVKIQFPPDTAARLKRAVEQAAVCGAACIWCGFGYADFNMKAQDEHLATCAEYPVEGREHARKRLLENRYNADGNLPEGWTELE
jgi:hypothetical protein